MQSYKDLYNYKKMNIMVTATAAFGMIVSLFLGMPKQVLILTEICMGIACLITLISVFIKKIHKPSVYIHPLLVSMIGFYLTIVDGFGFFYYLYGVLGIIMAALYYSAASVAITANVNVLFYIGTYLFFKDQIYFNHYEFMTFSHILSYAIVMVLLELAMYVQCSDGKKLLKMQTTKYEMERQWNKNILDNADQGFLTINRSFEIDPGISKRCVNLFSKSIEGQKIADLFYPDDEKNKQFINELLAEVFKADDSQKDVYLSLMPEHITYKNKVISFIYKVLKNINGQASVMVIVTDITEKLEMASRMEKEQAKVKMIVHCLTDRFELLDILQQFEGFVAYIKNDANMTDKVALLREIHTFKGLFSLFEMSHIVQGLDDVERDNSIYDKSDFVMDIKLLKKKLELDLNIIRAYLGEAFLQNEVEFKINKWRLDSLIQKVRQLLIPEESQKAISIINTLYYRSVREQLKPYVQYSKKLAERLDKPLKDVVITGDDVYIDYEKYKLFFMSLVHIFRNCVDHGLESEEERAETDKTPEGMITCHIEDGEGNFNIIIEDDGKGIDCVTIREQLILRRILEENDADKLKREELLEYVFHEGFSTKKYVSDLSGRGVGLSSVKNRVLQLGGSVQIHLEKGGGTKFLFQLPKPNDLYDMILTSASFMNALCKSAKGFVRNELGYTEIQEKEEVDHKMRLSHVTILNRVSGDFNAIILIGFNDFLVSRIVEKEMGNDFQDQEINKYRNDALAEVSNIILGNCFREAEKSNYVFDIGAPVLLETNSNFSEFKANDYLAKEIMFDSCSVKLIVKLS